MSTKVKLSWREEFVAGDVVVGDRVLGGNVCALNFYWSEEIHVGIELGSCVCPAAHRMWYARAQDSSAQIEGCDLECDATMSLI